MKLFAGFLCAVLFAIISTTTDAKAYTLTNTTPIAISGIIIEAMCGPFGPAGFGPYSLAPGASMDIPIDPPCMVTGIVFRGTFFPVGYSGPIAPPNPPNGITVTATGATFW